MALLSALAVHQRRLAGAGGAPLLDPALLRIDTLRAGLVTHLSFWCGQAALFLALALYLQDGRGLDPLGAGLVFAILAAAYLGASLRAPAFTLRFGRDLIAVGARRPRRWRRRPAGGRRPARDLHLAPGPPGWRWSGPARACASRR
jgi:hypothetical protein